MRTGHPRTFIALRQAGDGGTLDKLQLACGESHCFETVLGGLNVERLNTYAANQGLDPFSPETLSAFEEIHALTKNAYAAEINQFNIDNVKHSELPDPTSATQRNTLPLYIPDQQDYLAAAWYLKQQDALPDEVQTQLDIDQWKQIGTEIDTLRQSDPAFAEAMTYMEREHNRQAVMEMISMVGGELPIASAIAKAINAVKISKLAKLGKIVADYNPITKGPLPDKIANTFRSSTYSEILTTQPTTLYRVYGGEAVQMGPYWTRIEPSGPVQSIIDSALNPQWGNNATKTVKIRVPEGTKFYEGVAAPQGGLVGGGNQVYFDSKVPTEWIVE